MIFPKDFFDSERFEHFEHKALFENISCVWEALPKLKTYIDNYLVYLAKPYKYNKYKGDPDRVNIMPGAIVGPEVVLGQDVLIEPHAYIKGPAIIGDRSLIRHGAYIRENVIIGKECLIGNATEIKNSILMDGAKASHLSYIGDSILGFEVNLGAGVKLANKKITDSDITIRDLDGQIYATGLRKLGAIIGDKTEIGCNAVLNPGTLVGMRCLIYSLVSLRGTCFHDQVVKNQNQR